MARRFDPEQLFEVFRSSKHELENHPYPTLRAELEGGKSRRKPLSRYSTNVAGLTDDYAVKHMFRAFDHGLVVTLYNCARFEKRPFGDQPVTLFTSRPEELWRVPAVLTWSLGWDLAPLHRTRDVHESLLLGYSPTQIERWHRHHDSIERFYVYSLITRAEKARVIDLGHRCFGSAKEITGSTFFMYFGGPLKKTARRFLPKELTLARTKCNASLLRSLLGDPERELWRRRRVPLIRVRVSSQQAHAVNRAMRSRVELLTSTGWR